MSRGSLMSSLVLTYAALTLITGGARADFNAAQQAFEQKDYVAARKELDAATVKGNPDARLMLGIMERNGLAGPVDPKAAFVDLSLAIMASDSQDLHDFAFRMRRKPGMGMSPDEIAAAEQTVGEAAASQAGLTGVALTAKITDIKSRLASCKSECDSIAIEAFRLGPAASDVIPELEALMTRDYKWMPRLIYAQTLAVIGSKAVPALGRIMTDKKQIQAEGPWNLQAAALALYQMGPVAQSGRPILVQALLENFDTSRAEFNDMGSELTGQSPQAMLDGAKVQVASALAQIGDPDRDAYAKLALARDRDADPANRLLASLAMAMTYDEFDQLIKAVTAALKGSDEREQTFALEIMPLIAASKETKDKTQTLLEVVLHLTSSKNSAVRTSGTADTLMQEQRWSVGDQLRDKNYKAAIAKATELLAVTPWNTELMEMRAESRRSEGDIEGAIADYKKAMEIGDVYSVQFMLHDAGVLTEEEETGLADAKTLKALETCVRNDACFAKMRQNP